MILILLDQVNFYETIFVLKFERKVFLTLNKSLKSSLSSMMGIVKHKDRWVLAVSVQLVQI